MYTTSTARYLHFNNTQAPATTHSMPIYDSNIYEYVSAVLLHLAAAAAALDINNNKISRRCAYSNGFGIYFVTICSAPVFGN